MTRLARLSARLPAFPPSLLFYKPSLGSSGSSFPVRTCCPLDSNAEFFLPPQRGNNAAPSVETETHMPKPSGRKKPAPQSAQERRKENRRANEGAPSTFLPDYSVAIVESVREPLVLLDSGLRVLVANAAFYRTFGVTPAVIRRRSLFDLAQSRWDSPELHTVLQALQERDIAFENHDVRVTIDDQPKVYRLNAHKLDSPGQDSQIILLAFEDVTEELRMDERLRDLARMEAVGQLAGGVAHEINNQMTVLTGFMAYVTKGLETDDPKRKDLQYAERAADHVVYITRQLLNFSRKQLIRREIIDPWTLLQGMQTLLGRVIGSGILVNIVRKGKVRAVEFDATQLGEVFINLALNARYAMERAGTLEITLSTVEVPDAANTPFSEQPPGRYVRIEVRDTGTGMDQETLKRAFEPFFTTKPIGEGTGLGLASVLGAVTQNGGFIRAESQLGVGTTFIIELPEVAPAEGVDHARIASEVLPRGEETVLVADDEDGVRRWISRVLRDCGYTVLEACQGEEALQLFAENADTVRLVLTDLVMPGADGREVGERMGMRAPDVPVLYMSAYTQDEIMRRRLLAPGVAFLQKPFSPWLLAQRVRAGLDGAARTP
jgi:signal transduction histidine kinase